MKSSSAQLGLAVILAGFAAISCEVGTAGAGPNPFSDTWVWSSVGWTQQARTGPQWREGAASVFDSANGAWLLFGGQVPEDPSGPGGPFTYLNDTWTWDGSGWNRPIPAVSPPPRSGASAVYDKAMGMVVLFGGTTEVESPDYSHGTSRFAYDDMWAWNGASWRQLHPAASPPSDPFITWQGAYDPTSRTVIAYANPYQTPSRDKQGLCTPDTSNGYTCPSQMWSWNGQTWTQLHPKNQLGSGMIYEDVANAALMAWGYSEPQSAAGSVYPYPWRWNGVDWVENTAQPLQPDPAPHSMFNPFAAEVYGTSIGPIFAFGGSDCSRSNTPISTNDTWLYNGDEWQPLASSQRPPGREETYLMYDSARKEIVLWGGIVARGCPLL
jgi:hypothetical protein